MMLIGYSISEAQTFRPASPAPDQRGDKSPIPATGGPNLEMGSRKGAVMHEALGEVGERKSLSKAEKHELVKQILSNPELKHLPDRELARQFPLSKSFFQQMRPLLAPETVGIPKPVNRGGVAYVLKVPGRVPSPKPAPEKRKAGRRPDRSANESFLATVNKTMLAWHRERPGAHLHSTKLVELLRAEGAYTTDNTLRTKLRRLTKMSYDAYFESVVSGSDASNLM